MLGIFLLTQLRTHVEGKSLVPHISDLSCGSPLSSYTANVPEVCMSPDLVFLWSFSSSILCVWCFKTEPKCPSSTLNSQKHKLPYRCMIPIFVVWCFRTPEPTSSSLALKGYYRLTRRNGDRGQNLITLTEKQNFQAEPAQGSESIFFSFGLMIGWSLKRSLPTCMVNTCMVNAIFLRL